MATLVLVATTTRYIVLVLSPFVIGEDKLRVIDNAGRYFY